MALAFKLIMGASAITSVMIIAATERGPAVVHPINLPQEHFEERFPYLVVTPKQDRERAAVAPAPERPAHASAEVKVQSGHNRKLRVSCERRYYYIKGHRYWRCKRARN